MSRSCGSVFQATCLLFLSLIFISGCARIPLPTRSAHLNKPGVLGSCADFFAVLDQLTAEAEVLDPGAFRVKNYPYLRVNRFLASFRDEVVDPTTFALWIDRLQELDQTSRQYEIANLPNSAVAALDIANDRTEIYSKVATCGNLLKAADFLSVNRREELKNNIAVPDEYIGLRRFLGIYPFTSMFIYSGVLNWHAAASKNYSPGPPVNWRSIRYTPSWKSYIPSAPQTIKPTKRDALGIPVYAHEVRKALFRMYAPVWEIQFEGDYDRIGTPMWTAKGVFDVDTEQPLTYTLLSFTRFGKEILTQLNYIIWFPSRPKESALDIYGGFLDGVNYRVTLDRNYEPLLYETVHNCGCYYKAFPTNRLVVREKIDYAEPPLILEAPDMNPATEFMTVSMESRTHYVQHLYPLSRKVRSQMSVYSLVDYDVLRSLPYLKDDRRSIFSQDSIAPGSKRLERFILWPTGVLSPGAMRQWGRHAVAFVGKRHFDDPFFMDRMFVLDRQ